MECTDDEREYEIYFWKKEMVLCWIRLIIIVFLQLPAKEGFLSCLLYTSDAADE